MAQFEGAALPALKLSAVSVQLLVYIVSACLFAAFVDKFSHHRSSGLLDTKMRPAQQICKCPLPCERSLEVQTQGSWGLQPASGLCLYSVDANSWKNILPEAVNGHRKVAGTSASAPDSQA